MGGQATFRDRCSPLKVERCSKRGVAGARGALKLGEAPPKKTVLLDCTGPRLLGETEFYVSLHFTRPGNSIAVECS
jgi:hypothetical protein